MQLAANEINNNPNLLPNVYLQLYPLYCICYIRNIYSYLKQHHLFISFTVVIHYTDVKNTQSNTLLASMFQIQQNNVRGIAGGYFSVETQNVQLAAKIYSVCKFNFIFNIFFFF